MPRRSSRAAPASAAAPTPAPKRRASAPAFTTTASKKQKSDSTTGKLPIRKTTKKSKYFRKGAEESKSEGSEGNTTEPPDSESDTPPKGKAGKSTKHKQQGQEDKPLWKEGVKTGLGPGKEVFVKKPKARDAGKTPYEDHTLHPNTLLFLKDLAKNNERSWFKAHDADYQVSKKDWQSFVECLSEKISGVDSTIPELPAKDLIFRIHRDMRFSRNPTPYKDHFSAAWSRTGKKGSYAAYYVHCQPGSCFVGESCWKSTSALAVNMSPEKLSHGICPGVPTRYAFLPPQGAGLWNPEADKLARIREEIDSNSHQLKAVLNAEGMRREIFDGIPDDEEKAVEAFVNQNKGSALKIKPKGYDVDNENIQLLRLRSFTIGKPLMDGELLSPNAQDKIVALIGIMEPFVTYLNSVVMPDLVDPGNISASESDATD
ncbi:DUF2461 domain-containing protein [Aspergillus tanneri]|uniref:DUF2461 domain-containing protein n=1 Tax=Aspergillus tanneri TaxID=1220188 RepID=A0A5M9MCJ1_9EURO|nr:uncharacterized protein ATNIH1004_010215 [Aspergillus tanneri]KAA8643446.1 hypothetical protein ATNIH1004_010215 [Aspergillus tanneri]